MSCWCSCSLYKGRMSGCSTCVLANTRDQMAVGRGIAVRRCSETLPCYLH